MNGAPDGVILDHLGAVRRDMARMADIAGLQSEMTAMRQMLSGVTTRQQQNHADIASLKARVKRIERRLELVD